MVLTPVLDLETYLQSDYKISSLPECMRQVSAEMYWRWVEDRISAETESQCVMSIKSIYSFVAGSDTRFRVVLTQSASTLSKLSPFSSLEKYLVKHTMRCVRLKGTDSLTTETLQSAIISSILGGDEVYSNFASKSVSLGGLDLSIFDDQFISLLPPINLVIILEDCDSIDRQSLFQMISLLYYFNKKVRLSLILESNLNESLIEETMSVESIFLDLNIVKLPLLSSRDLEQSIKRIFFGPGSDTNLAGYFPVQICSNNLSSLSKSSVSLIDLTAGIFTLICDWFKQCPKSYLLKSLMDDDLDDEDTLKKISEKFQKNAIINRILNIVFPNDGNINDLSISRLDSFLTKNEYRITSFGPFLENTVQELEKLSSLLIREMGISPFKNCIESLRKNLIDQIKDIKIVGYNQKKLFSDFNNILKSYCLDQFSEFSSKEIQLISEFRGKKSDIDLVNTLVSPSTFSSFKESSHRLVDVHGLCKHIWGQKGTLVDFEQVVKDSKLSTEQLSTSLATLELLGLVKPPTSADVFTGATQGNVKLRKTYHLKPEEEEEEVAVAGG